ncbi:MAG: hypothetical protein DGJ47_000044 [Rickettsiaceae bacterium]
MIYQHFKGWAAEQLTCLYYMCFLYVPLKRRYKTKVGEIDLVMRRMNKLVFVEVKARRKGMHENIISYVQQKRIKRAAELFIIRHPRYNGYDIRFDLALVKPYSLPKIIKSAW